MGKGRAGVKTEDKRTEMVEGLVTIGKVTEVVREANVYYGEFETRG